ncbi:hypothetical protein HPB51_006368 [Rhipicephalus microplus]|uniref:Uncharacterized protein n=1 Tax=Rhipicephalus microplus TaxID=6941 RepID=A0A9J6DLD1_RHIMP|nr:hypothetical protein HPB51_006368 [Rhipicephalus microplus]
MAQSRTTDPDIPASTTLRSGRVLSNSPPITDGVQASTAAPHHDCSEAISRGFSLFAQELKTSGFGCASFGSFNENEIPYFHGFKDDPTNWVLGPDAPKRAFPSSRTFFCGVRVVTCTGCLCLGCALCRRGSGYEWAPLECAEGRLCATGATAVNSSCMVASESPRVCHVHLPRV